MRWLPHRGGAQDFREFQQAQPGKPFPVAVAIGADPATLLAAVTPIPDTLVRIPVRRIAARTQKPDSALPPSPACPFRTARKSCSKGHIHPGRNWPPEGPFADHTGYYNSIAEFPVFTVEQYQPARQA